MSSVVKVIYISCIGVISLSISQNVVLALKSWPFSLSLAMFSISCFPSLAGYELERRDSPGQAVDLSSTLESQGTLDFILVKNVGEYVQLSSCAPLVPSSTSFSCRSACHHLWQ